MCGQSIAAIPDSLSITNVLLNGGRMVGVEDQKKNPKAERQKTGLVILVFPDWNKLAVSLGIYVLISDMGC